MVYIQTKQEQFNVMVYAYVKIIVYNLFFGENFSRCFSNAAIVT